MAIPAPVVKTAPTIEAISISEAKTHLRVDSSDEDAMILAYVKSSRRWLERRYNLAFLTQTLVLTLDTFGQPGWWPPASMYIAPSYIPSPIWGVIELWPPVQSVTSITYIDFAGATQTLSSSKYAVDTSSYPGRIAPAVGQIWPVTGPIPGAVKIEWVAGHISADLVPEDWKEANRLALGHYYLNRESVVTDTRVMSIEVAETIDALMAPYAPILVA